MADMRHPYLAVVWLFLFYHFRGQVTCGSNPALRVTLKFLVLGQPKVAKLDQWPGATIQKDILKFYIPNSNSCSMHIVYSIYKLLKNPPAKRSCCLDTQQDCPENQPSNSANSGSPSTSLTVVVEEAKNERWEHLAAFSLRRLRFCR